MDYREVSIIIFYDKQGRILLQDRQGISKGGELWGFFGGGIEPGETKEQALVREIKEELEFDIQEYDFLKMYDVIFDDKHRVISAFLAPIRDHESKFRQIEGSGMAFFSVAEAKRLKMFEGDYQILDDVSEWLKRNQFKPQPA
ncbi:MAG: NUDIX domain-containing protein [Nanoarchaeota archaeon]